MRKRQYFLTRQSEAGFTLIELLVVLAILGFLASIATPAVMKYFDSAKLSTARTEVANLSASLDLFKFDVGRYPTTQEGLSSLLVAPPGVDDWAGPYLKKTTTLNDPWRRPYNYRSPGEHGDFDLYSFAAKGEGNPNASKPPVANW